jgi:predicted RNA-binding Zn ribbon-like protein
MANPRPAPFFVGDDLALDFLNSVAAPWGQQVEWIANGADLTAWLEQAHAVPADVAARYRTDAMSGAVDAVASRARQLREWFRKFVEDHAGKPIGPAALRELAPLNQLLEREDSYLQIEIAACHHEDMQGALRRQRRRRWGAPEMLLLPIAEAIGDLICRKDFTLVRKCEGPDCTLWFHDVSKGHARRWCSMAVCGNRAKAAAHRTRLRNRSTHRHD